MLESFLHTLSFGCHLAAVLVLIYGAFCFIGGMLGLGGARSYLHAGVAIVIGTWLAGLTG